MDCGCRQGEVQTTDRLDSFRHDLLERPRPIFLLADLNGHMVDSVSHAGVVGAQLPGLHRIRGAHALTWDVFFREKDQS